MKKLFFALAAIVAAMTVEAQPQLTNVNNIYVYGVDFSKTKINGAKETDESFVRTFDAINDLMLTEPSKYNFDKAFRKNVEGTDIAPTQHNNRTFNISTLRTDLSSLVNKEQVQQLIKGYELTQTEGTGVVVVAMMLDKTRNYAKYNVVFFDIATREVIFNREVIGKAKGFGLRNFWAYSVYDVLKNWKLK